MDKKTKVKRIITEKQRLALAAGRLKLCNKMHEKQAKKVESTAVPKKEEPMKQEPKKEVNIDEMEKDIKKLKITGVKDLKSLAPSSLNEVVKFLEFTKEEAAMKKKQKEAKSLTRKTKPKKENS